VKHVWENLVWLMVLVALAGTIKLSIAIRAAMSKRPLEQAGRGVGLDQQIGEVQARLVNRTDVVW
jgi:hypothetical protein